MYFWWSAPSIPLLWYLFHLRNSVSFFDHCEPPNRFILYCVNQTTDGADVVTCLLKHVTSSERMHALETFIGANNVTTYNHDLTILRYGSYIFKFTWIDPDHVTTVTCS